MYDVVRGRATLDLNKLCTEKSFNLKFVMEQWGMLDRTICIWMLDALFFLNRLSFLAKESTVLSSYHMGAR